MIKCHLIEQREREREKQREREIRRGREERREGVGGS